MRRTTLFLCSGFAAALLATSGCSSSATGADGAPVDPCTLIPPPADCPVEDAGAKGVDAVGVVACTGATAEAIAAAEGQSASPPACPTCPNTPAPVWALPDFQPQSCGYTQEYGLGAFEGRVTVVAILAGW